jgi:hypothetical protein
MSYLTIAKCVADADVIDRVRACVADEGGDPAAIPAPLFWQVAAADDIEAAYASALAAGNPAPGADPAVITDGMILGVVQANTPAP